MIKHLTLTPDDIREINVLVAGLAEHFDTPEDPTFMHNASIYAHSLPIRVRQILNDFRLTEANDETICLISGYPVDDQKIGPTPPNRELKNDTPRTLKEQMLLIMCGSLLGEPFGWATQQAGYIVNDILPVQGDEHRQVGSSSDEMLMWHTEEAFHPYRCDYLALMCLRNPNRGATMVASNQVVCQLTESQIRVLFEPRFVIRPDEVHVEAHKVTLPKDADKMVPKASLQHAHANIARMINEPEKTAVFSGDPTSPYMIVDSLYQQGTDEEAQAVFNILINTINEQLTEIILQPGDICFIDNYRNVHGRKSFKANYDGTDRWLKRINITRDIRKSRSRRLTSTSRIIF